jgi:hypothetical protein
MVSAAIQNGKRQQRTHNAKKKKSATATTKAVQDAIDKREEEGKNSSREKSN